VVLMCVCAAAQVLAPTEIKDPALRQLQSQYLEELQQAGRDILALKFDYPFYLSRKLDLDESQQKSADQRSLRFEHFNGKTVLAITGNYYAAYPADDLGRDQRAREDFLHVVMPVLKATVPHFQSNKSVQGYALEISHHILGKVMNVAMERPENLVVYLPQNAAIKLLAAKDDTAQQAALLEGQSMLNAQPVNIWISGEAPVASTPASSVPSDPQAEAEAAPSGPARAPEAATGFIKSSSSLPPALTPPKPARDTSPEALAKLEATNKDAIARLQKELAPQAHFVDYAPPDFYVFRQGIYLELSISTPLPEAAVGSRYKVAALAFDDHVAHLIRPTLAYFKGEQNFDGIAFSSTPKNDTHDAKAKDSSSGSEAIEFFFPFEALRCYERYDCTGQQLIDAGAVLINGERVSLDLQVAEGSTGH
jgi:hypothetical protein